MKSITLNLSLLLGPLFLSVVSCYPSEQKKFGPFPLRQLKDSNSVTTTTCGGSLNATTGEISYKLNEPVAPNERCVWIIRARNTTDYSIGIFSLGFSVPNADHQVTISGFAHGHDVTQVVPTETGLYSLNNCSLIVITFNSGSNPCNYKGFSLQYSAFHNGGIREPNALSEDVVVDANNVGYVRYPEPPRTSYANLELSTFLFPQRNRARGWGGRSEEVSVVVVLNGLQTNCADYLDVFYFNPASPNKWDNTMRICNGDDTSILSHNDAILVVFQSDTSTTSSGFHFTYARCSGGACDGGECEGATESITTESSCPDYDASGVL